MNDTPMSFHGALVLTGGGTGGHFFPAVALAEAAAGRWPGLSIAFVGACRGIEARELPQRAWPYQLLEVEGLVGRSPWRAGRALLRLGSAVMQLRRNWASGRPAVVVGTGGYAAAPALLAARSLGIPYFLHESNAAPGALIRLLAPGAKRVWCGMEAVRLLLPGAACRVVGTPVREAFRRTFRTPGGSGPRRMLVLGGSGGARAVNEAMLELAPRFLEDHADWEILHQVGMGEMERLGKRQRHTRHQMVPFIEAMDEAMESAALVVGRSGASTCAELKAAGRPAVLVPLPTSANDHQRMNAEAMAAEGRARVVLQAPDLGSRLDATLRELAAHPARLEGLVRPAEPNLAVARCLEDLETYLGWRGSAIQATPTETA